MGKRPADTGREGAIRTEEHRRFDLNTRKARRISTLEYLCEIAFETLLQVAATRPCILASEDSVSSEAIEPGGRAERSLARSTMVMLDM